MRKRPMAFATFQHKKVMHVKLHYASSWVEKTRTALQVLKEILCGHVYRAQPKEMSSPAFQFTIRNGLINSMNRQLKFRFQSVK